MNLIKLPSRYKLGCTLPRPSIFGPYELVPIFGPHELVPIFGPHELVPIFGPHELLPIFGPYESITIFGPYFRNIFQYEIEKVDSNTELTCVNCSTINKIFKVIYLKWVLKIIYHLIANFQINKS